MSQPTSIDDPDFVSLAPPLSIAIEQYDLLLQKHELDRPTLDEEVPTTFTDAIVQCYRNSLVRTIYRKYVEEDSGQVTEKEFAQTVLMHKSTKSRRQSRLKKEESNVRPTVIDDFTHLFVGAAGLDARFDNYNLPRGFDVAVEATLDTITFVRQHFLKEECKRITSIDRACAIIINAPFWLVAARRESSDKGVQSP